MTLEYKLGEGGIFREPQREARGLQERERPWICVHWNLVSSFVKGVEHTSRMASSVYAWTPGVQALAKLGGF